jgi:hypothetical protein
MRADEEGTLERLKALRRELTDPKIAEHHGRTARPLGPRGRIGVLTRRSVPLCWGADPQI